MGAFGLDAAFPDKVFYTHSLGHSFEGTMNLYKPQVDIKSYLKRMFVETGRMMALSIPQYLEHKRELSTNLKINYPKASRKFKIAAHFALAAYELALPTAVLVGGLLNGFPHIAIGVGVLLGAALNAKYVQATANNHEAEKWKAMTEAASKDQNSNFQMAVKNKDKDIHATTAETAKILRIAPDMAECSIPTLHLGSLHSLADHQKKLEENPRKLRRYIPKKEPDYPSRDQVYRLFNSDKGYDGPEAV